MKMIGYSTAMCQQPLHRWICTGTPSVQLVQLLVQSFPLPNCHPLRITSGPRQQSTSHLTNSFHHNDMFSTVIKKIGSISSYCPVPLTSFIADLFLYYFIHLEFWQLPRQWIEHNVTKLELALFFDYFESEKGLFSMKHLLKSIRFIFRGF